MILCGAYFCAVQVVKKLWHFVLCWCDGRFEAFLSHYCQLLGARTDEIYQQEKTHHCRAMTSSSTDVTAGDCHLQCANSAKCQDNQDNLIHYTPYI